jgi:hypothetical protein
MGKCTDRTDDRSPLSDRKELKLLRAWTYGLARAILRPISPDVQRLTGDDLQVGGTSSFRRRGRKRARKRGRINVSVNHPPFAMHERRRA